MRIHPGERSSLMKNVGKKLSNNFKVQHKLLYLLYNLKQITMKGFIQFIKDVREVGLYLRISKKTGKQIRIL